MTATTKAWLSTPEMAQRLGIATKTLQRLVKAGRFNDAPAGVVISLHPGVPGQHYRWQPEGVEKFLSI